MKALIIIIMVAFTVNVYAQGYKIGDVATDFSLKNVDGKNVAMKDKNEKGYIVVFTCNHCPFAKAYEERIIELDKKYASKGYPVIAINPNDPVAYPEDSYDNMKSRAAEMKYTFPYLVDETQLVAKAYGATRTPHIYLVQKDGDKYIVKYIGAIDNNSEDASKADKKYLENAVDALIAGKDIELKETKAVGCSIKWKQ